MNVRSRGRRLSTVLAAILVSFTTGCTETESTVDPRPTAEPAAIPDDPTADVTTIPGELALATSGVGPFLVDVPARPSGHRITVRVSCVGPGGFRVTDAQARYVFGVARCSQHAVYGAAYDAAQHGRHLTLTVAPDARWRVAVYVAP